jgi:hypothetical protein
MKPNTNCIQGYHSYTYYQTLKEIHGDDLDIPRKLVCTDCGNVDNSLDE